MTAIALTIAGSDSGGGAGIQADLKTFSALSVFGTSVITALTAQNTQGVTAIHDVPAAFITAQMDAVFSDIAVNAVKIGMLSQVSTIDAVANGLRRWKPKAVILDPVMVAESGDPLIDETAISALVGNLFPVADLITPNLHEAARLLRQDVAEDKATMEKQAKALLDLGAKAVLLKGGHAAGRDASDILLSEDQAPHWLTAPFIDTKNTHGTGCSLSSAIAAGMARGKDLQTATEAAKQWLTHAITHADELSIGNGAGPVHHFHALWETQT